ncbi:MAG: hypothetical protein LV480_09685 [Methylacidiphilales bacterium]|nr:hypothetical protein [Candidatus Methylacidiphilales bacterium]
MPLIDESIRGAHGDFTCRHLKVAHIIQRTAAGDDHSGFERSVGTYRQGTTPINIQIENATSNGGCIKITTDQKTLYAFTARGVDGDCDGTTLSDDKAVANGKSGKNMRGVVNARDGRFVCGINPVVGIVEVIIWACICPIGGTKRQRRETCNGEKKNTPQQKFHFARKLLKMAD